MSQLKRDSLYHAHSAENQPEFEWQSLNSHLFQVAKPRSVYPYCAHRRRKTFTSMAFALEHHSAFDDSKLKDRQSKGKLHQASENRDMPVVVTTAVQFFESLFLRMENYYL